MIPSMDRGFDFSPFTNAITSSVLPRWRHKPGFVGCLSRDPEQYILEDSGRLRERLGQDQALGRER